MFIQEKYRIQFITPGFVGNADQSGEWRTPPFKALLRRWWRVVWWHGQENPTVENLRKAEGALFGWAADTESEGAKASQVRIRLDRWQPGQLTAAQFNQHTFPLVQHPEVKKPDGTPRPIGTALYLGYGPVTLTRNQLVLNRDRALKPGEAQMLQIALPPNHREELTNTMKLIGLFGTLGGRSRNGWGSFSVEPEQREDTAWFDWGAVLDPNSNEGRLWLRALSDDFKALMKCDWCCSLGRDAKGLLWWVTKEVNQWQEVLKLLAEVKIAFRTQFHFKGGGPHAHLCDRQILAYPVTRHSLDVWQKDRLANQIIFKVLQCGNLYRGAVLHLPHGLPQVLKDQLRLNQQQLEALSKREIEIWSKVHAVLDRNQQFTRLP